MYVVAVIADILSLLPLVNWLSDFAAAAIFKIFEDMMEVKLYSPEHQLGTMVTILIEFVPLLSSLPTWTIRVAYAKWHHRKALERQMKSGGTLNVGRN